MKRYGFRSCEMTFQHDVDSKNTHWPYLLSQTGSMNNHLVMYMSIYVVYIYHICTRIYSDWEALLTNTIKHSWFRLKHDISCTHLCTQLPYADTRNFMQPPKNVINADGNIYIGIPLTYNSLVSCLPQTACIFHTSSNCVR